MMMKGDLSAMIGLCLSPLPVIMAGLSIGFIGATIASAAGLLLLSILTFGEATVIYFAWDIAPSLLLVYLALKHRTQNKGTVWYPIGYMLSWLSLLTAGIALLTILAIVAALDTAIASTVSNTAAEITATPVPAPALDIEAGLKALILKAVSTNLPSQIDAGTAMAAIEKIVAVFMTVIAVTWLLRIVFVAYIAEYILLKKQKALRPKPSYTEVYVQNWALGVVADLQKRFKTYAKVEKSIFSKDGYSRNDDLFNKFIAPDPHWFECATHYDDRQEVLNGTARSVFKVDPANEMCEFLRTQWKIRNRKLSHRIKRQMDKRIRER